MKFSIITPTFNKRPESLSRLVDCIQRQTFRDFEHIICYEEERYIELNVPQTHHVVVKECTEYGNKQRIMGIQRALGDYLIFVDDDNILFDDALETINSLSQDDNPDIIYSPIFHRKDRELGTEDFRFGGVDLLQWCIKLNIARKFEFPLKGYSADWEFFSRINGCSPKINRGNRIIGVHWFPAEVGRIKKIPGWFNCRELYNLVVGKLPQNPVCAEVGVFLGRSAISLAKDLKKSGLGGKIYAIDKWIRTSGKYTYPESDFTYRQFLAWVKKFNVDDIINPIRANSVDASSNFSDQTFDFVFLDAGHEYEDVVADIRAWLPKVKKGGILAGDDYHKDWPGVIRAVNEAFGSRTEFIGKGWLINV